MFGVVPAIIAASVAIVVAVLTPALTSWRVRRQAVADLFDDAVAALLLAQTSRHHPSGAPAHMPHWTEKDRREFSVRVEQSGVERWIQAQERARAALARLETFVPEIRQEVSGGWEIREEQEPVIRDLLEARRARAIKSERLFRLRSAPRPLSQ